jgi:hypothetical protein
LSGGLSVVVDRSAAAENGAAEGGGSDANSAVTVWAAPILIVQRPRPGSSSHPVQPAKVLPGAALARSTTFVSLLNSALQTGPQLIPAGRLSTLPSPVPVVSTVSNLGSNGAGGPKM